LFTELVCKSLEVKCLCALSGQGRDGDVLSERTYWTTGVIGEQRAGTSDAHLERSSLGRHSTATYWLAVTLPQCWSLALTLLTSLQASATAVAPSDGHSLRLPGTESNYYIQGGPK